MQRKVESVFELYALALAVGQGFAQRYHRAARQFRAAGDLDAAALFETIEELECALALQIDRSACGACLPQLEARKYIDLTEPRLSGTAHREQAFDSAIAAELALRTYYARIANEATNEDLQAVAAALASDRDRHVWRLRRIRSWPSLALSPVSPRFGADAFALS